MKNKEIVPHIERACTWSLNTIIWSYHSFVIINTDIMAKNKKFSNEEQIKILDKISNGHIPYQQSLLTYLVYYLGACAENYNINNISFKVEKKNISNLINYFFKTVSKYQKDKNLGYQPSIFKLDDKVYNFNKSIIKAHQPKLNQSEIINIAEWFVNNLYKDTNIQRVFIGARHYFHLENTGFMNKVAGAGKSSGAALLKLKPGHFDKFKGTGLDKYVPLRLSYILMNLLFSKKIFYNYLNNSKKRLKKVKEFSKGPYVSLIIKKTLYFNNKTAKYFGEVKYDPIHGKWTNVYKDGSIIKIPHIMHGKGTYTYKDGSIIKGTWIEGKIHGKIIIKNALYFSDKTIDGKYIGADGGALSGSFNKGKPQGIFSWKMKSGRSYTGRISIYFSDKGIDLTFNGRGTLKHPGRGGLIQTGVWKNGEIVKREKSNSPYITFMSSINEKNILNDSKYYTAFWRKIIKIKFDNLLIYSVKELPYKKDRIKLALKRLLMFIAMKDDFEWGQNNLARLESCFLALANFQSKKKIKPILFSDAKTEDYKLSVNEIISFKDYIEFCSKKYFKYPEKMKDKLRENKNKKL